MPEYCVTVYAIDGTAYPELQPTIDRKPMPAEDLILFLHDLLLREDVAMVRIGNRRIVPDYEAR